MATVASIRADLIGSSAVFRSEMIRGAQQANTSLGQIQRESRRTADSIIAMNKAAAGFIGLEAVKRGVGDLVDAQLKMQSIHYTLQAATGSSQLAGQAFAFVQERAHALGLDLEPTAEGFARLSASATALGISMSDQEQLFDAYAKASTTLHLSSEKSTSALMALEQMMGKGKIQAQELRLQLGQAIPGAAARFQNSVMEMVKGTDLAGKSFDQLLQAGDLTTTRFLPALISALQESGRGWEEASHGMNAELNRLRTNWFQMKADVSGGLFNDVATGSVRLMADNLEHLADVAGVTGGIVVSRLAGVGLGKVYDAGAGAVAAQRQAREAAEAASTLAKANVEVAAAEVKSTQAALAGVTAVRQQALEQRGAAEAIHAKAVAENNAAQATLAHQQGAATLSANIRAQRLAMADAAIAQNNLARAQRQYDAAVASGNTLKTQQIALEARLIEAKAASAAATEAQVMAERQLAASSAGGLLARSAGRVGSLALGLVGGPIGAAVLAIGAIGFSFASARSEAKKLQEQTEENAASVQDIVKQSRLMLEEFDKAGNGDPLSKIRDSMAAIGAQIDTNNAKLAEQQKIIDRGNESRGGTPGLFKDGPRGIDVMAGAWYRLTGQYDAAKGSADQLKQANQQLADTYGTENQRLVAAYAGAWDGVAASLGHIELTASGVADWLGRLSTGVSGALAKQKDMEAGRAQWNQYAAGILSIATDLETKLRQKSMTPAQIIADNLKTAMKSAAAGGVVNPQGSEAYQAAQRALVAQQGIDAAAAAKKAAQEAISTAKRWKDQADNLNQSLQQTHNELLEQLDSTSRLTPAQKTLAAIIGGTNDAYNHASAALKAKMLAEAQDNVELSKKVGLQQQATKDAQAYAVVQDNLARIAQQSAREHQDSLAGVGQGSKATADQQGLTALRRQYEDLMASAGKSLRGGHISQAEYDKEVAAYKASLDQQLRDTQDFYDQRDALQSDWKSGAVKAMDDWGDAAANNADLAAGVVNDAASSMTDALTNFATTGKLSFSDFANSIIKDLARIAYQKAIAGLFDYAIGAMGYDSTGGAGAATYNANGGVSHVNFGGGRAGGGSTAGGSLYEVAEGGRPELYQSGGRTYLLSGQDGHVTPARAGSAGAASSAGGAPQIEVHIHNNAGVQVTQKASTGNGGMPRLDVMIDQIDQAMADRVNSGKSRTAKAISARSGTSMAANI